jgi:hypothetical protein
MIKLGKLYYLQYYGLGTVIEIEKAIPEYCQDALYTLELFNGEKISCHSCDLQEINTESILEDRLQTGL